MDIKTLSELIEIPVRQVRYVIDHGLVPERYWMAEEHPIGHVRTFNNISAIFIACAAFLLQAGHKRDGVRALMEAISRPIRRTRNPLRLPMIGEAMTAHGRAKVQFADGRYVRWIFGDFTEEWFDSATPPQSTTDMVPKVIVEIDVGAIRDLISQ